MLEFRVAFSSVTERPHADDRQRSSDEAAARADATRLSG